MFAAITLAALLSNVIGLPRWASEGERQMREIAERALGILASHPATTGQE